MSYLAKKSANVQNLINYIVNDKANNSTLSWNTYADAAGSQPVDGTGGSPNVTFSRNISNPLRQSGDFLFTKDAANRQGQGVSYDFTIDLADQAKVLTVSFDYQISSGTYSSGDLAVYLIADPTGTPVVIQPAGYVIQSATAGTKTKQIATFQTQATGQNYRLCFHVASTSASAYVVAVDNIFVGPQVVQYGSPVTDWQSFTPTGSWTTNTTYIGKWRRVGDSMEVDVTVKPTGLPNAANLTINFLPSGYAIDTTKLSASELYVRMGYADGKQGGSAFNLKPIWNNSTSILIAYQGSLTGAEGAVSNTSPVTWNSGDVIHARLSFPVQGWSSTVQMSNDTDTRVVAAKIYQNSAQALTNSVIAKATNLLVEFDTHGAWNSSLSRWYAPVPGVYEVSAISTILTGSGDRVSVYVYKNNTIVLSSLSTGTAVGAASAVANGLVQLNSGDYLELGAAIEGSSRNTNPSSTNFYMAIRRISGPSAIAASETVAARYLNTSAQTVTQPTVTILNYAVADYDTHGAVTTGVNWKFTAPISGKYSITGMVTAQNAAQVAGNRWIGQIFKNGSFHQTVGLKRFDAALTASPDFNFVGEISLVAGDYIDFRIDPNVTGSLSATTGQNWIAIKRTGN